MPSKNLILTNTEEKARKQVYEDVDHMYLVHNDSYPEFNGNDGNRTLVQYIDDSEKRLNGTTYDRASQGKEDWQENFFNPLTRQKLRAIVAGVALSPPEVSFKAFNREGIMSMERAEIMKHLTRYSYLVGNPRMDMFWEVWHAAGQGTVVKYDAYKYRTDKVKIVTGYDQNTGQVTYRTSEEVVEDGACDEIVPLSEFLIWDIYIHDIQKQPKLAWIQYYDKDRLTKEFKKYNNFKYILDGNSLSRFNAGTETYHYKAWGNRTQNNDNLYEVIRYYSMSDDKYEIWVNGVPLLRAPLLWGRKRKHYPFAKSIHEPFANRNFFYGKSFPSVVQGWQDINNTLWNTILDNAYRSLDPLMLIGLVNKDLLDIEDEVVSQDNKIYVPDVNQVKPMPSRGVQAGDVQLLQMVARGLDMVSIDPSQQGATGSGVTAREILIADERAKEMKGIFYMFIEDLWLQKYRLRTDNVLTNYMLQKVEKVAGKNGATTFQKMKTVYNIPDVPFSDGTVGVLGLEVVDNKKDLPTQTDIEGTEDAMMQSGINYKGVAVPSNFFDDWEMDFLIVPESLENASMAKQQAIIFEKQQTMATLYPEYFAANKEKEFAEFIGIYGEKIDEYTAPPPPQPQTDPTTGQVSPLDQASAMSGPLSQTNQPA